MRGAKLVTEHKHGGKGTAGPTALPLEEAAVQTQALAQVPDGGVWGSGAGNVADVLQVVQPQPSWTCRAQSFKGLLGPEMGVGGWREASAPPTLLFSPTRPLVHSHPWTGPLPTPASPWHHLRSLPGPEARCPRP